ncbi:NnrS family protein [Aurantimonas sp. A3-2-R12]|uniref:NnrS family protein n=1 Tax=Aurantimonas sp. A3-2-R12 TaxID=3114362 RepID=UPI002E19D916|nr:NnrS family protein [Aurantimonas sp. A3-2-R12]
MSMPPLLSYGFRPFFLLAALWGGAAVPLWLLAYRGSIHISNAYGDLAWHAHELIFGYAAAVICGFLFTAIPNWTGRFPVKGAPLLFLVVIWVLGRLAMLGADWIGLAAAAVIDVLFLVAVIGFAAREIIAGSNWRNLRVLVLVGALLAGNVLFHVAILRGDPTDLALRLSIAALIALITLVGGRVIPSFTRNWLVKHAKPLPSPFGKLDALAIGTTIVALLAWVVAPEAIVTAGLALLAAALLIVRLLRWRGWPTWREPILAIMHIAYAFVPAGFLLLGASVAWPDVVPASAVIHSWTIGAIGTMTLAVMTRASLGHTGRSLNASPATIILYAAMLIAALARIAAALTPEFALPLLSLAGAGWSIALLGFAIVYGPMLAAARPRRAKAETSPAVR